MPHSVSTEFFSPLTNTWPSTKTDKQLDPLLMRAQNDRNVSRPRLPLPIVTGPVTPPSDTMKFPRNGTLNTDSYPPSTTTTFDEGYMSCSNSKPFTFQAGGPLRSSSGGGIVSPSSLSNPSAGKVWQQSPTKSLPANPSLKIPHTVLAPQSDLPELAAEVTCLFWFENGSTVKLIDDDCFRMSSPRSISSNILPSPAFRKWVDSLLVTTQVTQNVVLLALLFVYRLKMMNPAVRGSLGSEYRLLTVALMLGNKCKLNGQKGFHELTQF
jgi:hypothetical protein